MRLLQDARTYYQQDAPSARHLFGQEESIELLQELAAWTSTVRVILNLDEFIIRD